MKRLVDDWSLDDPASGELPAGAPEHFQHEGLAECVEPAGIPTECEPERMVQIAIEVGAMGPKVLAAMVDLCKSGRIEVLLDLVEKAPSSEEAAPVWDFLVKERILDRFSRSPRIDIPRSSLVSVPKSSGLPPRLVLLDAAPGLRRREDADAVLRPRSSRSGTRWAWLPRAAFRCASVIQREFLALLGRLSTLPSGFSPRITLANSDPRCAAKP